MERTLADKIGMLATVMNALAVSDKLAQLGVPSEVFTSIEMPKIARSLTGRLPWPPWRPARWLFSAAAPAIPSSPPIPATALRAVEVSADVMFKAHHGGWRL